MFFLIKIHIKNIVTKIAVDSQSEHFFEDERKEKFILFYDSEQSQPILKTTKYILLYLNYISIKVERVL